MFIEVYPQVLGIASKALKCCTKCSEYKPRAEFTTDRHQRDGLHPKCKACIREYRAKTHEHLREYDRKYYAANVERKRENKRKSRQNNPERDRANTSRWKESNREHRDAYMREYNKNYVSTPTGRAARDAGNHRRRVRKTDNGGMFTAADLAAIRATQTDAKGRLICWRCGKPIKGTPHLDHWIPLAKGGTNNAGNLHYMHARCNLTKHAKHPTELGRLL